MAVRLASLQHLGHHRRSNMFIVNFAHVFHQRWPLLGHPESVARSPGEQFVRVPARCPMAHSARLDVCGAHCVTDNAYELARPSQHHAKTLRMRNNKQLFSHLWLVFYTIRIGTLAVCVIVLI